MVDNILKFVSVDSVLRPLIIAICFIHGVCSGVCPATHFVMRGTELKLGMGVGGRPPVLRAYFQSDPIKSQGHSEVKLL